MSSRRHARAVLPPGTILLEVGEVGMGDVESGIGFVDSDCADFVKGEGRVLGVRDTRVGESSKEGLRGCEDEFGMGSIFGRRSEERSHERFEVGSGRGRDIDGKCEGCFGVDRDKGGSPRV
jgi:hypothetical protein